MSRYACSHGCARLFPRAVHVDSQAYIYVRDQTAVCVYIMRIVCTEQPVFLDLNIENEVRPANAVCIKTYAATGRVNTDKVGRSSDGTWSQSQGL